MIMPKQFFVIAVHKIIIGLLIVSYKTSLTISSELLFFYKKALIGPEYNWVRLNFHNIEFTIENLNAAYLYWVVICWISTSVIV